MISAARFPYLSIRVAAARARSRLGGSCKSHSMQLLALVIAAAMSCLRRPSPQHAHTIDVCQFGLQLTEPFTLVLGAFAIFDVGRDPKIGRASCRERV